MLLAKYPPGLLSLLDLKVGGAAPRDFADTVVPLLDVSQFYRVNQRQLLAQDSAMTNIGDVVSTTVPNGKLWLVEGMSATFAMAAGDTQCSARIFIATSQAAGSGFRMSVGNIRHVQAALAAVANWSCEAALPAGGLLLPAGSVVGCILDSTLPGARTVSLRTFFSEFDV